MAERIIGTPAFCATGLALKSTNRRKNPIDGESRVYVYVGTAAAVYNAYNTINQTDYLEVEIDETGAPEYRLIVTAPDDSAVNAIVNYELVGNELSRSIWESERARALGFDVVRDIRGRVNRQEAGTGLSGDAKILYQIASLGVDHWEEPQFVYRVTKVVSRKYTLKIALNNIAKIYTTTQVLNETSPPPGLVFSISDVQADSTAGGPNDIAETSGGINAVTGWFYGWFKGTPTVQKAAGYRIAVTTEFKKVKATSFLYQRA
jgi:hypothetical protein